jgi:Lrp/AsnC family transcriptional regulator, leucine-responsive regulatory protein
MDALDLKILVILDADARRSYADVAREFGVSQPTVADRIRRLESRGIVRGAMLRVDHARLGFNVSAFVRLRATASRKRGVAETARAMPQVIEMYSVTGDDCMIARVVARSVEELAEILQRLSMFADSSTSVVLETIIPLRNPIPAQLPAAAAKSLPGIARVRRNRVKRPAPPKGVATKLT